jgi:hypothetical protein
MKIVDRKTFLALPAGTVYAKYVPSVFEGLCIKGDSLENDWFYQQIGADAIDSMDSGDWGAKLDLSEQTGCELAMDFDCQGRDGCFDDDQLFAVFSNLDVEQLIERLRRCLTGDKG